MAFYFRNWWPFSAEYAYIMMSGGKTENDDRKLLEKPLLSISRKVRVGVIGAGRIGRIHLENLATRLLKWR